MKQETDILEIQKRTAKEAGIFRLPGERVRASQKFNRDAIHIVQKGQKLYLTELMEANREDTEVYPTLEKYGCIEKCCKQSPLEFGEQLNPDLMTAVEIMRKGEEIWSSLNIKTREFYENSKEKFIQNAHQDFLAEQEKMQKKAQKIEQKEVKNDGKQTE
uniref:Internal scaffolding protein n=1 Tax=Dulem virus 150 TaxID=3145627 RepID=A0AAU8AVU1_9VIRU